MDEHRFTRKQEISFLLMVSLFWFAQYIYIPYQTTYLTLGGVSSSFTGIVVGAYGVSQLILRFPVGLCADFAGRHKRFLMAGTFFAGLASVFRIFGGNGMGFLVANLFSGTASAMWISFMVFYTGHYGEDEQQTATSRIVLFNNLGMLLGFLTSTLTYNRIGMEGICFLSVCAGLAAFLLSLQVKEKGKPTVAKKKSDLLVCSTRRLWFFSFLALIQQGIQLTTAMSFTNQILKDLGGSDGLLGVSSVVYMLSAVCFAAFASKGGCKRKGSGFWIPTVFVVGAVYCVLVPFVKQLPVLLLLQLLPGMSTGILFSYLTSEAMYGVMEQCKATAMGIFQAVYAIGMTLFPVLTGMLVLRAGTRTAYIILAGFSLFGWAVSLKYYKDEKTLRE